MHFIFELLVMVKEVLLAFLVAWFRFFIPGPRKNVIGEIVLVTGAGRGMGRELSVQFSRLGATVVLWDIDKEGMEMTKEAITAEGGKCFSYFCDVGDRDQVEAVGDKVKVDVGDVSILVNNAGVVAGKKLLDLTPGEIEATFNTNLLGVIWVTKKLLPSMLEHNHGHIVNMASSCGLVGVARLCDYSASKSGVIGFTEVLSYEMAFSEYEGIHTTLVCPSYVKTGMFDGCQMAYPSILSDLELQPTVARIMQGVLTNQTHVYIPRLVYFITMLKTLLPTKALMDFIRFCKADKFMDSFVGHPTMTTMPMAKDFSDEPLLSERPKVMKEE